MRCCDCYLDIKTISVEKPYNTVIIVFILYIEKCMLLRSDKLSPSSKKIKEMLQSGCHKATYSIPWEHNRPKLSQIV